MTDYAHTRTAQRARLAKATKLAQLAWMRDWSFIAGADATDLRDLRLEAHVGQTSDETWQLAHDLLAYARERDVAPTDIPAGEFL